MSTRSLSLVLLGLAAAGGLAAWSLLGDADDRGGGERGLPTTNAAPPAGPKPAPDPTTLTPAPGPGAPAGLEPAPERVVASSRYEEEVAAGHWVEGRVVVPKDTPLDERVSVVARGRKLEHGPLHQVEVGGGGNFRVSFSERTRTGRLDLDARYLHLEDPVRVNVANPPAEGVTLEALLGGVLRGQVVLPEDTPENRAELVGKRVVLTGRYERDGRRERDNHDVVLDESLTYEFHALPVEATYSLTCDPSIFVAAEVDELLMVAGDVVEMDLELELGVELAGRVVDEAGQPVPLAQVSVNVESTGWDWSRSNHRSGPAKEDGTFRLRGVAIGRTTVTVNSKGYEEAEEELGRLEPGTVRDDLVLVLRRGNAISGRVLWPDGTPVAKASIQAESEEEAWGGRTTVRSEDDGSFELAGLEVGTYRISASGRHVEEVKVVSKISGKERIKKKREVWRASQTGVDTGTTGLSLTLTPGLTVSGQVVDDEGTPLPRFEITTWRTVEEDGFHYNRDRREKRIKDEEGRFTLDGFEPGRWELRARADGHLVSEDFEFEVPLEKPLPRIGLLRTSTVKGVVIGADGTPLGGAGVRMGDTHSLRDSGSIPVSVGGQSRPDSVKTNARGEFELDNIPPGTVEIVAWRQGWAPSDPFTVELHPGEVREAVSLTLQVGGRITGELYDLGGQIAPRRRIEIEGGADNAVAQNQVQTDAQGLFVVEGLTAGKYEISVPASAAELRALDASGVDGAQEALTRQVEVTLEENGSQHVVLRPPDEKPIRLGGLVRAGGESVDAQLWIWAGGNHQSIRAEASAETGYEVFLPGPGEYRFQINLSHRTSSTQMHTVAAGTKRLNLDLAVGSIRGRVFGPGGEPVSNITVQANRQREPGESNAWSNATVETEADGSYHLEDLPAGRWRVSAGGDSGWVRSTATRYLARAEVEDLQVDPGAELENVDLHLTPAGALVGTVRFADGSAARYAQVYLLGPDGTPSGPVERSDGQGGFRFDGLEPGTHGLSALAGVETSPDPVFAEVHSGEDTELDLTLARGTLLRVVTRTDAGPIEAQVRVTDSNGGDVTYWRDWTQSSVDGEHSVGPLRPGTYEVSAEKGELKASATVELDGEAERELKLVLSEG